MAFTLKLEDVRVLSNSISILSEFITESTFSISKEGVKLVAMDPANISMIILNLLPSSFVEYTVSEPTDITLSVDGLKQALKRARPGEIVTLTEESNKLKVVISGKSTKTFLLPLIEATGKSRDVPSLDFNAVVELDSNEFRDFIDSVSIVGDAVKLEASAEKFNMSAGETGRVVNIDMNKGSDALIKLDVKESSRSIYSTEYLKKMTKAGGLSNTAVIKFSKDYPLKLEFNALDKLQIFFILAPRIENK